MDKGFYLPLLRWLLETGGWAPRFAIPEGLEVIPQAGERGESVFVVNYAAEPRELELDQGYRDLITGAQLAGRVAVPARDVMILVPSPP
jgi:beta-galactosidase